MNRVINWLAEKIKKPQHEENSKFISDLLTEQKYRELQKLVGFQIRNKDYFIQALMHRSFLEQNEEYEVSNERLEFLGDSVLSLVVAEYLFKSFPEKDEGFLTKVRAKLVNRFALADAAENINLFDFLLMSKNLSNSFSNGSKTVLSDALEALIGAVYLDSGLEASKKFIDKILIAPNTEAGLYLIDENFKSQLLEFAQANKLENPIYEVIREEGPQHSRTFTIRVLIKDAEYGIGKGKNKKSAEQKAAQNALVLLKK